MLAFQLRELCHDTQLWRCEQFPHGTGARGATGTKAWQRLSKSSMSISNAREAE